MMSQSPLVTCYVENSREFAAAGGFFTIRKLPQRVKPESTSALRYIAGSCSTPYVMFALEPELLEFEKDALQSFGKALESPDAIAIAYSDYTDCHENGNAAPHPLNSYSEGSVSDNFEMGKMILTTVEAIRQYLLQKPANRAYAGVYAFRLWVSLNGKITHIDKSLYTAIERDNRKSGQKQFDYLNPSLRRRQKEMEVVFTEYLKKIGAYIAPEQLKKTDYAKFPGFECEASVIIPVRNRARTIADAVGSALAQSTKFAFNVIVVDNHSTDGTTEILQKLAQENPSLIHIVPERTDLGIGGCWQLAADDARCGKFAVQLDSDDIYSDNQTLEKIIHCFHRTRAAMVVGSYRLVDFNLNPLPPGVIDHKEWTTRNGHNNALRVNGLGAPRAFFTPMLREIRFPNTSYGEDYAMGLAFSRQHILARIYDVLYLCRRWNDNSDAALSQEKTNANNAYKDSLRAAEIIARKKLNSQ